MTSLKHPDARNHGEPSRSKRDGFLSRTRQKSISSKSPEMPRLSRPFSALRLVLWLFTWAAAPVQATPRDLTGEFVTPAGLAVTLWAESPHFFNPTSIDVDYRGRIWVAEAVNYRAFRGPDVNQPAAQKLRHPAGDRILILEDTDGDGACDSSKVFVQDKDLVAPLGVAVLGNKVVVSCSPSLIVFTDDNGDDQPDKKAILLTGFGGLDHDHGLHSVVAGPDGRGISTSATPVHTWLQTRAAGRSGLAAFIRGAVPTTSTTRPASGATMAASGPVDWPCGSIRTAPG
jgi:hypothetical protein